VHYEKEHFPPRFPLLLHGYEGRVGG
jgi:hypothetical protein